MTRLSSAAVISAFLLATANPAARGQEPRPPAAPEPGRPAPTRQEADWRQFRSTFPYHLQTIAVSAKADDGTRTLIVSEPPPHVTVGGLVGVDRELLADNLVRQWGVGFDGWVKDVVVRLPRGADVEVLTKKLSAYLFFTDYKAFALPLPADPAAAATRYPLDVAVRTTDLDNWYATRDFVPAGGGAARKLEGAPAGVYLSRPAGLVAWVVPRGGLGDRRADARAFALDSDLVLGAVAGRDSVAVFGRERVAPVTVLPPLRTEMILTLAAATGRSLAQSYERNAFAAGSSHARWDWAPIYLSPELLDTEYGSILNLTDQMLKAWTQYATTQYYNFDYPTPSRLPFDEPLFRQLKATSLLFNWNTTGFGLRSDTGTRSVYAVTRTGALPVIYLAERGGPALPFAPAGPDDAAKATRRAEEQGYTYFATLNDPLLARAVQYATLYQVFKAFDISAPAPEWPTWNQSKGLADVASRVLKSLREAGPDNIQRAVAAELADRRERAGAAGVPVDADGFKEVLDKIQFVYRAFHSKHKDDGERVVATALGFARDFDRAAILKVENAQGILRDASRSFAMLSSSRLPVRLHTVSDLQATFSRTRPATKNPWLQTPTVVYSRSLGVMAAASGGHNLDSATTRVVRDATLERGKVRVGKDREVYCHPDDAAVVERQARLIARSGDARDLGADLERLLSRPSNDGPREFPAVTARPADYLPPGSGFTPAEHLPPARAGNPPPSPPPPPPPPPGTTPPGDPPPPGPRWGPPPAGGAPVEVLHLRQREGLVTLERATVGEGGNLEVVSTEHWNRRHLAYAVGEVFQLRGRTADRQPVRVIFGEGLSRVEARRLLDELSLHAAQSGRLAIGYYGAAETVRGWAAPTIEAKVRAGSFTVRPGPGEAGVERGGIRGTIDAKTEKAAGVVTFAVDFVAQAAPTRERVQEAVENAVAGAVRRRVHLTDLPLTVHEALRSDLGLLDGTGAKFGVTDIGDVSIVRFEHGGQTLDVVVTVRR